MRNQVNRRMDRIVSWNLFFCVLQSVSDKLRLSKLPEDRAKAYMLRAALAALVSLQALHCSSGSAQIHKPIPIQPWRFADIHLTVLGSSTVKIDWMPLAGANQYIVKRTDVQGNEVQVGPVYPAGPGATQPMTAMDNTAPANSHLSYTVTAYHLQTIIGLPGTPAAGGHTGELPMGASNPKAVDTPPALQPAGPLRGFVDLHTHPMANLGFGGKLLYGGVDVGSLLATDPDCKSNVRATSEQQALGHDKSTHGGWDLLNNICGDDIRPAVIHAFQTGNKAADEPDDATGSPEFLNWPVWNDITHQKMWVEWIRRAYSGGLRVMVALAVNNKTLGDMVSGPGDYPTDDKSSADLQITEIQNFVLRHSDFMEVAFNSSDVQRIVSTNKLAVVIGIEVDHIGNFQTAQHPAVPSDAEVIAEIDRLYVDGVRYIFPIHVLDNAFGGSAAYINLFNLSNVHEDGKPYDLVCAVDPKTDNDITYTYNNNDLTLESIVAQMIKRGWAVTSIPSPPCDPGVGQKNKLALTDSGIVAIKEMMRLGMLIDIDHMSQAAADVSLYYAQSFGYPVNSGHNGIRGTFGDVSKTERSFRPDQYRTIGKLHGMAGVGSSGTSADQWGLSYNLVVQTMGAGAVAGFGTDTDGFALGMPPPPAPSTQIVPVVGPQFQQYEQCLKAPGCNCVPVNDRHPKPCINSCAGTCRKQFPDAYHQWPGIKLAVQYTAAFPRSTDGNKTWDYNKDGVAHYGMLPDFLQDVGNTLSGKAAVDNLMQGAEYFYQTWVIAESKKTTIGP